MGSFFEIDQIASILEMLERHDVNEFKLERGDEKLFLRRGQEAAAQNTAQQLPAHFTPHYYAAPQYAGPQYGGPQYSGQGYPAGAQQPGQSAAAAPAAGSAETPPLPRVEHANGADSSPPRPAANVKEIRSPMVGTFYRRPAVDAEPYVSVGDTVKKGDVLCIVEAMKLMNEIETDIAGRIVEVSLEDGQMVEYGEVLFRIEPN